MATSISGDGVRHQPPHCEADDSCRPRAGRSFFVAEGGRIGVRVLAVVPLLSCLFAPLALSTSRALVVCGVVWFTGGAVMGILYDVSIPALIGFSVGCAVESR